MLRTALGPAIARLLEEPSVVEVMLNPDGRLWVDRLSEGLSDTGELLSAADGERIVRLVAHHVGVEVHVGSPRVSAELPETGERFEGLLPPVVAAPKADFEEAGAHFESAYYLTICYLPPAEDASRAESWLYEGRERSGVDAQEILHGFADRTDRILRLIEAFMPECRWLDDAETLTYLHGCVSTRRHSAAGS